jgi:hypothetical protein
MVQIAQTSGNRRSAHSRYVQKSRELEGKYRREHIADQQRIESQRHQNDDDWIRARAMFGEQLIFGGANLRQGAGQNAEPYGNLKDSQVLPRGRYYQEYPLPENY